MFAFLFPCFQGCWGTPEANNERFDVRASSDEEFNGGCSSAFKGHFIQQINQSMTDAVTNQEMGINQKMCRDLSRMSYRVGNHLATVQGDKERSVGEWDRLISENDYSWVRDNIGQISSFLHQEIFFYIYRAKSMTGLWNVVTQEGSAGIVSFGLIHEGSCVRFIVLPNRTIALIVSSAIDHITTDRTDPILCRETSHFSIYLTLHFEEIQSDEGRRLRASFNSADDLSSNWCHMRL